MESKSTKMRLAAVLSFLAAAFIITSRPELNAETVFLKDGSISEGIITVDNPNAITMRLKDNKTVQIPRDKILRILYTEIYMGKIYVQLTNGNSFICYQVDEDRNSYTFRNDILKPAEFNIKREEVLFIARGNPAGLTGEADTQTITLKWFAPYNKVKEYKIYAKAPEDNEFVAINTSSDKEIKIKNLKSNTKYQFRITAIDSKGDESMPSNLLIITTKNMPPTAPKMNPIESIPGKDTKISWKEATDVDGTIAGYRIYRKFEGKTDLLTETKNTEYIVALLLKYDSLFLTAVDDTKNESEFTRINIGFRPTTNFSVSPAYMQPFGELKDLASFGAGAKFRYELAIPTLPFLITSAELSIFYMNPKKNFPEKESKIKQFFLAPALISVGYAIDPTEQFAIIPAIRIGTMLMYYDYTYFDIPSSSKKRKIEFSTDPLLGVSLAFRYRITPKFYAEISGGASRFFERSHGYSYADAMFGMGLSLE